MKETLIFNPTTNSSCVCDAVIKWKRFKKDAILPTKRFTDAGFDIYAHIAEPLAIEPHHTALVPTGLGCCVTPGFWAFAADRGSTGSIGLHTHCGIIDEEYTGEIFIALHNDRDIPVIITPAVEKVTYNKNEVGNPIALLYPVSKGIAQIIIMPRYNVYSEEISDEEWVDFLAHSERGTSKLGQSGK